MNKYQEAINELKYALVEDDKQLTWSLEEKKKIVDTLQELVDNYSKIQQFNRAIFFNADGVVVNGVSYEQLEKALDKACETIAEMDKELSDEFGGGYRDKDTWKGWCLSDEKN